MKRGQQDALNNKMLCNTIIHKRTFSSFNNAWVICAIVVIIALILPLCSCARLFSDYSISNAEPSAHVVGPADKVELVYFHNERRCEACTYAEERITYLVRTYFADEIESGKLIFAIYDLGDKASATAAQRYKAIGSQLFINTIIDSSENIRYVEEIWYWGCIDNEEVFDKTIKDVLNKGLYGTTWQE